MNTQVITHCLLYQLQFYPLTVSTALFKLLLLHQFCFMQFCYFGYNGNVFKVLPCLNLMAAQMCPKYREERGIF